MTTQPADPRARRRARLILVAGILVGLGLLGALEWQREALTDWLAEDPARLLDALRLLAAAIALPLLALAAYLFHLARRVHRAGRFPPPGMAVTRETRILSGAAARRRAYALIWAALILGLLALASAWLLMHIGVQLMPTGRPPVPGA